MQSQRVTRRKNKNEDIDPLYMTPKELQHFQLAMRNSLLETENINNAISGIEEMKTFRPTEEEFADPLLYI